MQGQALRVSQNDSSGESVFLGQLVEEQRRRGRVTEAMQNTSHAVMAQRVEPASSLDDFPTPPWATRALVEYVLDKPALASMSCLEPACGRGHMAVTLAECFGSVTSSDVFDYDFGEVHGKATRWVPLMSITASSRSRSKGAVCMSFHSMIGDHRPLGWPASVMQITGVGILWLTRCCRAERTTIADMSLIAGRRARIPAEDRSVR